MPVYSSKSMSRLNTCEQDIQTIFLEVVKIRDCSIIEGHRSTEKQAEYFAKGREQLKDGSWKIVDHNKVITFIDGVTKKGKHNYDPSRAVDVVPYPEMWDSKEAFAELAGVVKTVQHFLLKEEKIEKTLEWGGNWVNFKDQPHYEITH